MKNFPEQYAPLAKRLLTWLAAVLLLADSVHSFRQHYQMCMDGDMTFNVTLSEDVQKVLHDPFALNVLLHDEQYMNPNRFFSHWTNHAYCWNVPLWLQQFVDPITSIYLSQAIFKLGLQLILIFILAYYISPNYKWYQAERLLPALLVTPFFQTLGFNIQMGIIDKSMTYDFFYAFPIIFLLIFFIPIYRSYEPGKAIRPVGFIWMIPCAFVIAFSGPLNLGVAPVLCILIFSKILLDHYASHRKIKWRILISDYTVIAMAVLMLFCVYSLYINAKAGTMAEDIPPLSERYLLLLKGIPIILTEKIGLIWLIALIALNLLLIRLKLKSGKKWLGIAGWAAAFCLLYIALLPLGGYRSYRPYIIRFDTLIPVTLMLVALFGATSFYIIAHSRSSWKWAYYGVIIYSLVYFTQFDKLGDSAYDCEKKMLLEIANSPDSIVRLSEPCTVMDWQTITDYHKSEKQGEMLLHWNVTKEKKLFYYQPDPN